MSKNLETKSSIEDDNAENSSEKRKQLRGKSLFKIKAQMEFYFSHANLRRDRFLGNLVRSNPEGYVPVDVFLTFNQIRKLTDNVPDIIKAISDSSLLELSTDNKKIRIKNQDSTKQNYDDCTIYVENLPPQCDHRYIKNIFCLFGSVAYVSLPRYRGSNKIKGFAFVEFNSQDSCKRACDAYARNSRNKEMATNVCKPAFSEKKKLEDFSVSKNRDLSLQKTARKRKWSENEKLPEKPMKTASESKEETKASVENEDTPSPNKGSCKKHKRRKRQSSESESVEGKRKRLFSENTADESVKDDNEVCKKTSDDEKHDGGEQSGNVSHKKDKDIDETVVKKIKLANSDDDQYESDKKDDVVQRENEENKMEVADLSQGTSQKEKKKNRKKRTDNDKLKLRVISKVEWKQYRNQYLCIQRKTMSSLKKMLQVNKKQQAECEALLSQEEGEESTEPRVETPQVEISVPNVKLEFQPGVIAKLKLTKISEKPFELIKTIRSKADVAFIDIVDNSKEAYVRFRDKNSAKEILKGGLLDEFGSTKMVTGAEETAYWEKLEKDREIHLNRPKTNKRGRDKIIAKATTLMKQKSTHTHFDESF